MPVHTTITIPRLSQKEFGEIAYTVMQHVFAIQRDFGRFFDERIYKQELALRLPGVKLEVPVTVTHASFVKQYFLDALISDAAIFEFKTVDKLGPRHRSQLLHYLFLLDLAHGKLVNMRTTEVEHEFVNTTLTTAQRTHFAVNRDAWQAGSPGADALESIIIPLLQDLGTGLDLALYEETVTHLLGGEASVLHDIVVTGTNDVRLGEQTLRLAAGETAFKITTFSELPESFTGHCRRLLAHTRLQAIQWVNITHGNVVMTTVGRQKN